MCTEHSTRPPQARQPGLPCPSVHPASLAVAGSLGFAVFFTLGPLIELTDPDSHGQACSGSKTMQATEQGQRTFTHNSPMAIPSWKYISLTAALSTVYLTR